MPSRGPPKGYGQQQHEGAKLRAGEGFLWGHENRHGDRLVLEVGVECRRKRLSLLWALRSAGVVRPPSLAGVIYREATPSVI